ncbi:MAG TPA: hypothetical protein VLX44_20005 [Xanthobacteraceae bacterium]|nr:hypothetical protein [Xanthobacteraceae bacterium]
MIVYGPEECRARARKCREAAERFTDPETRRQLWDLVAHWVSMARDIENIARMRKAMIEDT